MPTWNGLEYGNDGNGNFIVPRLSEWLGPVVVEAKKRFGENVKTKPQTKMGFLLHMAAKGLHVAFEAAGDAWNASFFGHAAGVALEKLLALFGITRIAESASTATLAVYGDDNTLLNPGQRVATETGEAFTTDAAVTIGDTEEVWVAEILEAIAGETYTVTVAGTDYDYPAQPGDDVDAIVDGLVALIDAGVQGNASSLGRRPPDPPDSVPEDQWTGVLLFESSVGVVTFLTSATQPDLIDDHYAERVAVTAENTGPVTAFAGTLNRIKTPVTGWLGVANALDAEVGRDEETDEELRARHRERLNSSGGSSLLALQDKVAALEGVEASRVNHNTTDLNIVVDGFTLTPHSVHVLVYAPSLTDEQVAEAIFGMVGAGIGTNGSIEVTVQNNEGGDELVRFDRAEVLYLWIDIDVTPGEGWPPTGDPLAIIQAEVTAWGQGLESPNQDGLIYTGTRMGLDVYRSQLGKPIHVVPGIQDFTVEFGTTPNPGDPKPPMVANDLFVDADQLVIVDSSRIEVEIG